MPNISVFVFFVSKIIRKIFKMCKLVSQIFECLRGIAFICFASAQTKIKDAAMNYCMLVGGSWLYNMYFFINSFLNFYPAFIFDNTNCVFQGQH